VSSNSLKVFAGVLGLAVVALAIFCGFQMRSLNEARQQNTDLAAQLADDKDKTLITAKRDCAERAASVFHSMGYSGKDDGGKTGLDAQTYTNHYNPALRADARAEPRIFEGGFAWRVSRSSRVPAAA
jgi:hypothetical protein